MANLNRVILAGNLTRDVETRYTPKGTAVAKFSIAINRKWRTEGGEEREEVTFVEIDAFGKTAETIGQYLRKGSPIILEGRLKLDQWDDKQTGQKRQKLSVICETFQFLNSGNRDGEGGGEQRSAPRGTRPPRPSAPNDAVQQEGDNPPGEDEDIPF